MRIALTLIIFLIVLILVVLYVTLLLQDVQEQINHVKDHDDWQDNELDRLREGIVKLEKEHKNES